MRSTNAYCFVLVQILSVLHSLAGHAPFQPVNTTTESVACHVPSQGGDADGFSSTVTDFLIFKPYWIGKSSLSTPSTSSSIDISQRESIRPCRGHGSNSKMRSTNAYCFVLAQVNKTSRARPSHIEHFKYTKRKRIM
uniref:Putative secreted protein n=1 Tax=Ixodes ricinus TaxID=34613 RepID=A0A6B0UTV0_IXORI